MTKAAIVSVCLEIQLYHQPHQAMDGCIHISYRKGRTIAVEIERLYLGESEGQAKCKQEEPNIQ